MSEKAAYFNERENETLTPNPSPDTRERGDLLC